MIKNDYAGWCHLVKKWKISFKKKQKNDHVSWYYLI